MSSGGLQAALAFILVDDTARASLHSKPSELQRRFSLTTEQMAALRNLDVHRLALTAHIGRAKRLDFLRRGLPTTLRSLELMGLHGIVHEFARTTWAPVESGTGSRALSESRRFIDYLAGRKEPVALPGWVHDIASFELMKLELLADEEASDWARRAAGNAKQVREFLNQGMESHLDHGMESTPAKHFVLGRHVRVSSFEYDVLGLCDYLTGGLLPEVAPVHTIVTVVKRPQPPMLMTYRTGEAFAAMLRFCARPRHLAEVLAFAECCNKEKAVEVMRRALLDRVLVMSTNSSAEQGS